MKFLIALLIFFCVVATVRANQGDDEKLSPSEEQEVRSFVKQFSATIERTRDLTPYLNKSPASDLMDKVLHDPGYPLGLVDYKLGSKIGKYQLRKFNIALWNIGYLSDLYIYSQFLLEKTAVKDLLPERQYPPNVVTVMKRNALLKKWWATKDSSGSETVLTTGAQVRSMLRTYNQPAALMRAYFKRHPPEQTAVYKQNLIYLEPVLKDIAVDRCSTAKFCAGLPLHTQEIKVHLPVLDLVLVRLDGQLKIGTIGIPND